MSSHHNSGNVSSRLPDSRIPNDSDGNYIHTCRATRPRFQTSALHVESSIPKRVEITHVTHRCFFVLSTTKLLHVSVSFLIPTLLYTADGETPRLHLYEDATTNFFGPAHLLYALLALVIIFLLIILPICLLVLYQFTCCKRCLSVTKLKGRVLDEFVYTFNQCYRDGSDGMMDCRWFAAFYIIIRLGFYLLLLFTMSALVYNLALLYSLVCALIVFIVQPYKEEYKYHNIVDPVLVLLQALSLAGITGINLANVKSRRFVKPHFIFVGIVALFPLVYLCIVTAQWMYRRGIFGIKPAAQQTLTPDLPDRILNSEDYYVNTVLKDLKCAPALTSQ